MQHHVGIIKLPQLGAEFVKSFHLTGTGDTRKIIPRQIHTLLFLYTVELTFEYSTKGNRKEWRIYTKETSTLRRAIARKVRRYRAAFFSL